MPRKRSDSFASQQATVYFRELLGWQEQVDSQLTRFNVLNCGRRAGKSSYCEEKLAETALESFPAGYFAPTVKTTTVMWESLKMRLEPVIDRTNEQERTMWLSTGGRIECWSHDDPKNGRGRKFKRIVVDEFRDFPKQKESWEMTLRASLNDYHGQAIFASTPKGMDFFHELYVRGDKELLMPGQKDPFPNWKSWTFPTSANPLMTEDEIEDARRELTAEAFDQEYLAKFVADGGAVFRPLTLNAVFQEYAVGGHSYVMGVDFGKTHDFSVFAVYDCTLKAVVHIDRSNKIDLMAQCDRLAVLAAKFRPSVILAEENSIGIAPVEMLRRMKLPVRAFRTSNASKARIVENMQLAIENKHISFYPDRFAQHEFGAFAKERLPGGDVRYGAPTGYHDDVVMACCIALDAGEHGVPRWESVLVA